MKSINTLETRLFLVKTAIEIIDRGYLPYPNKAVEENKLPLTPTNIHKVANDLLTIVYALSFEKYIVGSDCD